MSVKLDDTIYFHFGTSSPTTGAATNADSLPTVTIEEDGTALGYSPTVANIATGLYRVTIVASAANGFEAGRRYSAYVVATVGGVTGRDGIAEFLIEARYVDDVGAKTDNLPTDPADESLLEAAIATRAAPGAEMALIDGAVTAAKAPNLDAAVSTRALETGGNLATVMGKTNNLPSDPADESLLEAAIATRAAETGGNVAAIRAKTDNLPASPAAVGSQMTLQDDAITAAKIAAGAISSSEAPALAQLDAAVSSRAPEAGGNLAAVKAKTDNLPADPASNTQVNTRLAAASYTAPDNAGIASILAAVDTEIAAILAAVDTEVAAIKAKTDNLPVDPADESLLEAAIATRAAPGAAMTLTAAYEAAKTAAQLDAIAPAMLVELYDGLHSIQSLLQRLRAMAAGISLGHPDHPIFYGPDGTTPLLEADVDADGNRSAVNAYGG